ncbi:hypothetical protein B0H11DRAFT_490853 [Mycena galericulata]|nr:hypothetical protein B0H11DRAFT_490853 [Mycena galericulata]
MPCPLPFTAGPGNLPSQLIDYYSRIWEAATVSVVPILVLSGTLCARGSCYEDNGFCIGDKDNVGYYYGLDAMLYFSVIVRAVQWFELADGKYFEDDISVQLVLGIATINVVLYSWAQFTNTPLSMVLGLCIYYLAGLAVIEFWLGDKFRQHMMELKILRRMDFLVLADPVLPTSNNKSIQRSNMRGCLMLVFSHFPRPTRAFTEETLASYPNIRGATSPLRSRITGLFRQHRAGPIYLADTPDTGVDLPLSTTQSSVESAPQLMENVHHWLALICEQPDRGLWITTYNTQSYMAYLAETISRTISPDGSDVTVVDMSQTESVFWPLVRGLMMASPEYRRVLICDIPKPLSSPDCTLFTPAFPRNPVRPALYYDPATFIDTLICEPLKNRHHASAYRLPRTTIIVHGLRSLQQAEEMYKTIDIMHNMLEEVEPVDEDPIRDWYEPIAIVAISNPGLFSRVKDVSLRSICTLYDSCSGCMYSENRLTPPSFYKNLFVLLEDRIHLTGGHEGEQLYTTLTEISVLAETDLLTAADDATHSTLSLFSALNHALETRKRILECLTKAKNVTQSDINVALTHDGIKISQVLQMLFEIKSYEKDFPLLPRDHALAVLNLTNYILDAGAATNREIIPNYNIFASRAHILLNHLAQYLELLPDDLAIKGVVLSNPQPVRQGGFSDIYRGRYIKAADKEVEVAIKVLTGFAGHSDRRRQILHGNFSREALIWYHLKHKNIVPFLGVDLTTFTSPVRGMVSQWMPLGSVLKYMGEKSPCGPYAVELLCDVIGGLEYLHSLDIVHGDLCGRNILMDSNGRACLTDFGLAGFVESQASVITASRDGSRRWMAPELHRPEGTQFQRTLASDIWAFGCVACEIWSEGKIPFGHIGQGRAFIFPFPESTDSGLHALPYKNKPHDQAQSFMPDGIWDLVQRCWHIEPSERPAAEMISEMLAEMASHSKLAEPSPGTLNSRPLSSAPTSNTRTVQRSNKRIRGSSSAKGYSTVIFGPLDLDGDPEGIFRAISNGLINFVRRDALAKPVLIEEHDKSHLALHFHSLVEANNFSMTWTVHRFEPYAKVLATLSRRRA